jgi:GNAT superfamily N-acetyltransferase
MGAQARCAQGVRGTLRAMVLRLLASSDAALMERMMLLAGFPPERELPADALEMPHIRRFLEGWGRPGDVGVVALDDAHRPLGAAWARILDEPLLRDDRGAPVAEVAVAVDERARGRGIGTALMGALAEAAGAVGHRELSLTVSARNPAHRLYLRCGFQLVSEGVHGLVMRRPLR